jgi:hypothetical protein
VTFPTGVIASRLDRRLVIAGYVIFPLAFVPSLLFAAVCTWLYWRRD